MFLTYPAYVPEHVDDSCSKLKETEKDKIIAENCIIIKPCTEKYKINTKQLGFILPGTL